MFRRGSNGVYALSNPALRLATSRVTERCSVGMVVRRGLPARLQERKQVEYLGFRQAAKQPQGHQRRGLRSALPDICFVESLDQRIGRACLYRDSSFVFFQYEALHRVAIFEVEVEAAIWIGDDLGRFKYLEKHRRAV